MRKLWLLAALLTLPARAQDLPHFPKVDPESRFRELKVYQDGHPWRVPREDWEGARQRVLSGDWRGWLDRKRKDVDDWMARRRDRVDWVAGYGHDFVSPNDGSFLTFTPDEPTDFLSSPSDPKVPVTLKLHAAWIYRFRTQHW